MAWSLLQTKTASKTLAAGTTATVSLGNTTNGSLVVVGCMCDSGSTGGITSITCSGMSFTKIDDALTGDTLFNGSLWYAYNITGATTPTLTVNFGAFLIGGAIIREYSGAMITDPLDKHAIDQEVSANTNLNSGATATQTGSNDLVIGFGGTGDSGNTYTAGGGYGNATTLKVGTTVDLGMEEKTLSGSTAAQTATFTVTNSSVWVCAVSTFQELPPTPISVGWLTA